MYACQWLKFALKQLAVSEETPETDPSPQRHISSKNRTETTLKGIDPSRHTCLLVNTSVSAFEGHLRGGGRIPEWGHDLTDLSRHLQQSWGSTHTSKGQKKSMKRAAVQHSKMSFTFTLAVLHWNYHWHSEGPRFVMDRPISDAATLGARCQWNVKPESWNRLVVNSQMKMDMKGPPIAHSVDSISGLRWGMNESTHAALRRTSCHWKERAGGRADV